MAKSLQFAIPSTMHLYSTGFSTPFWMRMIAKHSFAGRPIRFGYKIWCLCGENDCPYQSSINTGKSDNSVAPLGTRIMQGTGDVAKGHPDPEK